MIRNQLYEWIIRYLHILYLYIYIFLEIYNLFSSFSDEIHNIHNGIFYIENFNIC